MEEGLKCLKIGPKRSNALWDILLAIEEKAKMFAVSPPSSRVYGYETNKNYRPRSPRGHQWE